MIGDMFRQMPPVTKNLLIINVLIWAAMAVMPGGTSETLLQFAGLHYFTSPGFGVWQLVTYMFVHANFTHLFFNMFALWMFGGIIEWTLGSRRFLFYYVSCGLGAALLQMGIFALMIGHYDSLFSPDQARWIIDQGWQAMRQGQIWTDPTAARLCLLVNMPVVGASGAIFGVLLAFGMLYPDREMYLMFIPVPIKAKWMVAGYAVLELALGIGAPADGVAHFAHLGGMLIGFFMIWYWKRKSYGRY